MNAVSVCQKWKDFLVVFFSFFVAAHWLQWRCNKRFWSFKHSDNCWVRYCTFKWKLWRTSGCSNQRFLIGKWWKPRGCLSAVLLATCPLCLGGKNEFDAFGETEFMSFSVHFQLFQLKSPDTTDMRLSMERCQWSSGDSSNHRLKLNPDPVTPYMTSVSRLLLPYLLFPAMSRKQKMEYCYCNFPSNTETIKV